MAVLQLLSRRYYVALPDGSPARGAYVHIFEPNTESYVTSYSDGGLRFENTSPVILDAAGKASVWVSRNVDVRITDGPNVDDPIILEELSVNPDQTGETDTGLVPNGSFETDADVNDVPDGWTEVADSGSNNGIDTAEQSDGAQSFRFTSAGSGGGSLTTSDFFVVNDVDDLRVSFDMKSSVAGVRNIVRVEWYDASQVSISNTDVLDDAVANPTAWTPKNLIASPPTGAAFAKLKLIGCDSSDSTPGSTWFDRVRVFYPLDVAGNFDNITVQNNEIISTNTNGGIDLNTNGSGVARINHDGGNVQIGAQSGTGAVEIWHDGALSARSDGAGLRVYDGSGNDPTMFLYSSAATVLGQLMHENGVGVNLRGLVHGESVKLQAEDTAGTLRTGLAYDPDGELSLAYGASTVLQTEVGGIKVRDTAAAVPVINLADNAATTLAQVFANAGLYLRSLIHGAPLVFQAEDAVGTQQELGRLDPDGPTKFSHAGVDCLETSATGLKVQDTSGSQPVLALASDAGVTLTQLLHNSGTILQSIEHGATVRLRGEDTAGTVRDIVAGDPDGAVSGYYAGTVALSTAAAGIVVRDTVGANPVLAIADNAGASLSQLLHVSGGGVRLKSLEHGGTVILQGEDAGGTLRNIINGDPDGATTGYYAGTDTLRTSDLSTVGAGAEAKQADGNYRPVGPAIVNQTTIAANTDLRITNMLHELGCTAAVTVDIDTTTNSAPNGSVWYVSNESGGNVTISATGVSLKWLDGAGGATGNRTLADGGFCQITKRSNGNYRIVGVGIS